MSKNKLENIKSVIDYIEDHLTEKLDLDTVAKAVHYSKYHLHRMFTNTVGLTIHDYLQRRRLTEAAKLLVFSDQSILDTALLAGYESQQAFTDAFAAMYKISPRRFRENERFYPLSLRFEFEGSLSMPKHENKPHWDISFASEEDIPSWMDLVRLVIDGFPHLHEGEYLDVLQSRIRSGEALILKDGSTAAGILLFSHENGSIDFMGCHPLYRNMGIPRALLYKVMGELVNGKDLSITTYREGDKADTGQRREIQALGFAEAELLVEFGYPTQKFILKQEDPEHEES